MAALSEEKISHLAHLVRDGLEADRRIYCKGSRKEILRAIKQTLTETAELQDEVREIVHRKLASYKRKIVEGSADWEILYEKTYREELRKRGL